MVIPVRFIIIAVIAVIAVIVWLICLIYIKEKYERVRYSKNNILDYDIDKNGLVNIYPENQYEDEQTVLPYIEYKHDNNIKYTDAKYIRQHRQRNKYNKSIHNNIIS